MGIGRLWKNISENFYEKITEFRRMYDKRYAKNERVLPPKIMSGWPHLCLHMLTDYLNLNCK